MLARDDATHVFAGGKASEALFPSWCFILSYEKRIFQNEVCLMRTYHERLSYVKSNKSHKNFTKERKKDVQIRDECGSPRLPSPPEMTRAAGGVGAARDEGGGGGGSEG